MVIKGTNHCYPNGPQNYGVSEEVIDPNSSSTHRSSFLYNFSILKEKLDHVESLTSSIFMPPHHPHDQMAMAALIQEILVTASSMMFACQQMSPAPLNNNAALAEEREPSTALFATHHHQGTADHWCNDNEDEYQKESPRDVGGGEAAPVNDYDVVEVEAADLLAKYINYCQVCGKGFKRNANLRMHMRAHGEEYKSSVALSKPMKSGAVPPRSRKYSCPQEGCRWNKKHARFQPLKSMICVKNHYKRSHCPKMYACKRCSRKQFSVLSDLRTHEKHCGDLKLQCSCGTTFSRKDKLMGHVALFVGHTPLIL